MFVANYRVTASDAAGLTATTTFTDGNVTLHLPATEGVANMTVNFTKHAGSTNCVGGTVTTGSVVTHRIRGHREHSRLRWYRRLGQARLGYDDDLGQGVRQVDER